MSTQSQVVLAVAAALVLVTLVLAVRLGVHVVRARRLLREAGVPASGRLATWGALLYLLSPVDLLPDPVLVDDIGVLLLALRSLQAAAGSAGPRRKPSRDARGCAPGEGGHT
ncbi:YkvA family protein [Streptomyces sp. TRM70308]|uniref:YkvA family protein n=1 Tax=Streptomyces sp. TRM70308 TaxID=3131932 RepID=UPI003D08F171